MIRTYGVMDNPKKTLEERGSFLRGNLADFLSANGLAPEDIWTGETHALWNAKLYPVCKTFQEAAQAGNLLVKMSEGLAEPQQIEKLEKTAETESGRILPVWKYRKYPFLEKRSGSKDPGGSISGRAEKRRTLYSCT